MTRMFTAIMTAYYIGMTRIGTMTVAGTLVGGIIGGVVAGDGTNPDIRDTILGTVGGGIAGGCTMTALLLTWPVAIPVAGAVYPIQKYKEYEYKRQVEASRSNLK